MSRDVQVDVADDRGRGRRGARGSSSATSASRPCRSSGSGPPIVAGSRGRRPRARGGGRRRARCRCRRGRAGRSPRRCRGRRRRSIGVRVTARRWSGAGELLARSDAAGRSGRGRRGGRRGGRPASSTSTSRSSPPAPSAATVVVAAVQPQADRVLVEGDGAVEVGDGQVDRAQAQRGGEDGRGAVVGLAWSCHQDRPRAARRGMAGPHAMHGLPARARAVGQRRLAVAALEGAREVERVARSRRGGRPRRR